MKQFIRKNISEHHYCVIRNVNRVKFGLFIKEPDVLRMRQTENEHEKEVPIDITQQKNRYEGRIGKRGQGKNID